MTALNITRTDIRQKPYGERSKQTKVFLSPAKNPVEASIRKRFMGEDNEPTLRAQRLAVEKTLKDNGIEFDKVRYSKSCGCSMCPCSPGFNVTGTTKPITIFLDYTPQ